MVTDQEMQAAEASRTDWYARAEARGVTADHVRPGVELDTWAALNPDADWAANEDRAAELARYPDQTAHYTDAGADVA
jgi:hypothetical protein